MTASHLRKILAALIGAPLIVGLATSMPAPYNTVLGSVLALIGVYVNWGHKDDAGTDAP